MIRKINLQDRSETEHLLHLQKASYMVEATLIGFYDIPPLNDTIEKLQHCGETFYGYYAENELAGAISYKKEGNVLDIHRLMVHPNHFRKGVAGSLLKFVEKLEHDIQKIIVATGTKNEPAKHLYMRYGFAETERKEIAPRLSMTFFEKLL